MSFCPSNDIHSIYLDNELPEEYRAEYETHLKSCPKCQHELAKLKAVSALLHQDSKEVQPDVHYLDESFDRLQIKMSYRKNADNAGKKSRFGFSYVVGTFAAAAAIVVALVLPVRVADLEKNKNNGNVSYFVNPNAISSINSIPSVSSIGSIGGRGTVGGVNSVISVSGNSASFGKSVEIKSSSKINGLSKNAISANKFSFDGGRSALVSGNIHEIVFSSNSNENSQSLNSQSFAANVESLDFLRPEFEDNSISIKITIPGVGQIPVTKEFSFPLDVMLGRF